MQLPNPRAAGVAVAALAELAEFVKDRLSGVSGTLAPLLRTRSGAEIPPADNADAAVAGAARQFAQAFVTAAAPFAPTAYSRARLIRQMHACGLLTDDDVRRTVRALEADPSVADRA